MKDLYIRYNVVVKMRSQLSVRSQTDAKDLPNPPAFKKGRENLFLRQLITKCDLVLRSRSHSAIELPLYQSPVESWAFAAV